MKSLKIVFSYQWTTDTDGIKRPNKDLYNTIRKFIISCSNDNKFIIFNRLRASSGDYISENIVRQIKSADIYIVDLTFLNRNVLLELGSMLIEKFQFPEKRLFLLKRKLHENDNTFDEVPSNLSGLFLSEYVLLDTKNSIKNRRIEFKDSNSFYSSLKSLIKNFIKSLEEISIIDINNQVDSSEFSYIVCYNKEKLIETGLKKLLDFSFSKPPKDVFFKFLNQYINGNPIYYCTSNDVLVGFVYCIRNSKGGYLESLCVHPEFRDKSIGSNLVNFLLSDNEGVISLTTRIVPYFEKFGFKFISKLHDGSSYMVKFQ